MQVCLYMSRCSWGISPSPECAKFRKNVQWVQPGYLPLTQVCWVVCKRCSWGISPSPECAWSRGYVCSRMCVYIYIYMCVYVHIYVYEHMYVYVKKKKHERVSVQLGYLPLTQVCARMYVLHVWYEYIRQAKPSSSHVSSAPADHTLMSHPTTSQTQQVSCVVI